MSRTTREAVVVELAGELRAKLLGPRSVAMPSRRQQDCPDCDGLGRFAEDDGDSEDPCVRIARCEGCDGTGVLVDCVICDEPMPLSDAEQGSGHCPQCRAELEQSDQASEYLRITRGSR
jgi:DnaJ-class molecular chaperone